MARQSETLPVTLLTGFLGSGKTTLLNRLLSTPGVPRIAVIENEFGAVNIDSELLVQSAGEEIVQLENGCLCCTVRGDLRRVLLDLDARRTAGELRFDRVVIEATGLALPAPVVQTFFADPAVAARFRLDGVVTVVDAVHGEAQIRSSPEAREQIGFADRLVLSKTDLAAAGDTATLRAALRAINPHAGMEIPAVGDPAADWLLDVGGFDPATVADLHPGFPRYRRAVAHESDIESMVYRATIPFDAERLELFLELVLDWYGPDLLRCKGLLDIAGVADRTVLQIVHRHRTSSSGGPWVNDAARGSVLVFIGRRLPREVFARGLDKCLVGAVV